MTTQQVPRGRRSGRLIATLLSSALLAIAPGVGEASQPGSGADRNHLAGEASPYLQLHVYNPVDWYPWGEEALARAKREDKPIFLSVGYSTCYWCHVMERKVFSDPEIAKMMNASFINIKVDREERPDIDTVYMQATHILNGSGGWPNSVFLTPEGLPFFAGTYFPPKDGHGRPGFPTVLEGLSQRWKSERPEIEQRARRVADRIERSFAASTGPAKSFDPDRLLASAVADLARRYEPRHGGFSERTKFPSPYQLEVLLTAHRRGVSPRALEMLTKTLDEMALGGINDQLAGGFHRYSTEPTWSVPHFEKMLYDNAQLLPLYARAHRETGNPLYARVAETIALYLTTEMMHPLGGFYSAQDAEVHAEEGASYVWTEPQVREILGEKPAKKLLSVYQIVEIPGEGAGALRVKLPVEPAMEKHGARDVVAMLDDFASSRALLLASRTRREQPLRDDKVLAGWNGLTIRGLVDAGLALERAEWIHAAERSAQYTLEFLSEGDGRLFRSHVAGLPREDAVLEDYAFLADGLLALYGATGDTRWLSRARVFADRMLNHFEGPVGAGFFQSAYSGEPDALFVRPRVLTDNVIPSGNTVALRVLLRLSEITFDPKYAAATERTLAALGPMFERAPAFVGTAVSALAGRTGKAHVKDVTAKATTRPSLASLPTGKDYVKSKVERSADDPRLATVILEISEGWHVNANPASLAFLIPTRVELVVSEASNEPGPKPALIAAVYPPGVDYKPRFSLEPLAVYEGWLEIPVELPEPLPPRAKLAVTFQACDATTCLRPETLELAIP